MSCSAFVGLRKIKGELSQLAQNGNLFTRQTIITRFNASAVRFLVGDSFVLCYVMTKHTVLPLRQRQTGVLHKCLLHGIIITSFH